MKKWLVLDKKTDKILSQHDNAADAYDRADAVKTCVQLSDRYLKEHPEIKDPESAGKSDK